MEVKYDKQRHQFEINIDEKLIRLEHYPNDPDTFIDCESVCPLAKNGIDCSKLRHPFKQGEKWNLLEFCETFGFDYSHLLGDKVEEANDFIPNYEDILNFYTSEEIENASNYVPRVIEDWETWLEKED